LSPGEQAILAQAPTLGDRRTSPVRDAIGKVWNGSNTAIGAIHGGLGMGAGEIAHVFGGAAEPGVRWRDNAIQFTNNPMGGAGAITIGNSTTYQGDPYKPNDPFWYPKKLYPDGVDPRTIENGHSIGEHEGQHTYQGQQLGPLYLPSNLAGGVNAILHGEPWHGLHNWNERGPPQNPPGPWAPMPGKPR